MEPPRMRVLLIEDDEDDYILTRELLEETCGGRYCLEWSRSYAAGRDSLLECEYDICLVDYRLGEGTGIDLLREMAERGCRIPVILLTGQGDRETDIEAIRSGAADYLVKGEITASILERSIRYALERHRLMEQIHALSLTDELTGLYNRRGFYTLAEQQLNILARKGAQALLLYVDLDGMKQVNDRFGHQAGDRILINTAELLRGSFRRTDVIARLGGDEFVVLAAEAGEEAAQVLMNRLHTRLDEQNAACDPDFSLALSMGYVCYDPAQPQPVGELLAEADALMYAQKQARKQAAQPSLAAAG